MVLVVVFGIVKFLGGKCRSAKSTKFNAQKYQIKKWAFGKFSMSTIFVLVLERVNFSVNET